LSALTGAHPYSAQKGQEEQDMPLRELHLLRQPILDCLTKGERPSWEIEEDLARLFNVTPAERAIIHKNSGCSVWTNDVAWGLSRLVHDDIIDGFTKRRAPNGKMRKIYRML
jgi:hypothetical protein